MGWWQIGKSDVLKEQSYKQSQIGNPIKAILGAESPILNTNQEWLSG